MSGSHWGKARSKNGGCGGHGSCFLGLFEHQQPNEAHASPRIGWKGIEKRRCDGLGVLNRKPKPRLCIPPRNVQPFGYSFILLFFYPSIHLKIFRHGNGCTHRLLGTRSHVRRSPTRWCGAVIGHYYNFSPPKGTGGYMRGTSNSATITEVEIGALGEICVILIYSERDHYLHM